MNTPTRARAIEAYGGAERWANARRLVAIVDASGFAFVAKHAAPLRRTRLTMDVHTPNVRLDPIGADREACGVLRVGKGGAHVRLERRDGELLEARDDPRAAFSSVRRQFWWDDLDMTYFAAYAFWNYLAFPALLLRDDIEWTEPEPATLAAHFPESVPTHCPDQRFHFDAQTGLLAQHDYTALVVGGWARVANRVLSHAGSDVPFANRRRVTPRRRDGRPRKGPRIIEIEVHELSLE